MKNTERNTPSLPLVAAALAAAGVGLLAGVLLAPAAGPELRRNLRAVAHKYGLLAGEQRQQLSHHLAQRAARLGGGYRTLARSCQGQLMRWGLLMPPARLPY